MKIDSVKASFPSKTVSNEEVVDLIRFNSSKEFEGDIEKTLRKIKVVLKKTGIENRVWLDKGKEKPIDHVINASEKAIKEAGIDKREIVY